MIVPAALPVLAGLLPRRKGISKRSHLRAVGEDVALAAAHVGLGLTFLAHQSWLMVDAIARTLVRVYVTRRNLLEWTTAAQAQASHDLDLAGFYRRMAGGAAIAAVYRGRWFSSLKPGAAWIAAPFVVLWLLSPAVAQVGQPAARRDGRGAAVGRRRRRPPPDRPPDLAVLRAIRRARGPRAAARTTSRTIPGRSSPIAPRRRTSGCTCWRPSRHATSAGSGRSRWSSDSRRRSRRSAGLERFRGHLYNWYDTRDLHALEPAYVSSVDSGNLAGHLLTLSNACRQMVDQPLPVAAALAGIGDAIVLTREAAACDRRRPAEPDAQPAGPRRSPRAARDGRASSSPRPPETWVARLSELSAQVRTLSDVAAALTADRGEPSDGELVTWAESTRLAVDSHVRDLALLHHLPTGVAFPTIAELSDPPVGATGDGSAAAAMLVRRLAAIADRAQELFREMDFSFLFDPTRKLLSIGFRTRDGTLDPSCYDLLASEARLASFLAIAKGDVMPDHWFRLGRALTPVGRGSALISWSGSMFEYLMPALVMRAPALSLLDHTYRLIVARQMSYAAERGVPWGISESAFNARDLEQTYQYSSFGVPGLGLKRGLSEDVVVAPYATALGAMIQPEAAVRNFARLRAAGAARSVRLPRGARLHGAPAPRGGLGRGREQLHGASPGDGPGGARQRAQRPGDGGAVPCRPDRRGHRAAPPGADAARRAGGPAAGRGGEERGRRARLRAADPASVHLAPRRDPAHAPALERAVRGDGDRGRIRVQPLARRRGDPLARGRDPGLVGQLPLPARHAQRRGVVGWSPAQRRRGGQLRGDLRGGSRRVLPSRRLHRDRPDRRRVGGARRGDPAGDADQSRLSRPPDRADVVCGDRPRAAGGRRRSPGLPEPVRRDGVPPGPRRPRGDPPAEIQRRAADLGGARRGGRGNGRWGHPVRDRSRPLHRPGTVGPLAGLGHRRTSALEHGRRGPGPDLQPPLSGQARPRRDRPRRSSRPWSPSRATTSWTWPTSTGSRPPSSGR